MPLVVIPCLNEARHIECIVRQMERAVHPYSGLVVIADGGSTDGTREAAAELAKELDGVEVLDNPARLQGPGINRAVEAFAAGRTHLLRVDAHADYPDDFVDALAREAADIEAASVVVGMVARGDSLLQRINASAQNTPLGNGGSRHRQKGTGQFVDHGHHALMRLEAFRAVGGYDERFSHNEDAELDVRLSRAGHRIWLTARTHVDYYPRGTLGALARQYFNYGRGRAQNLLKHRMWPKTRQLVVIGVGPALALAALAPVFPALALPALLWLAATFAGGMALALGRRDPKLLLCGPVAQVMHLTWSVGFWLQVLTGRERLR
ncbi:MAG: glycosyltransferase family 2 protein [Boseongicola sp.]|nr:glycosyltransferase family 2 protein [Boseongicola sp.]